MGSPALDAEGTESSGERLESGGALEALRPGSAGGNAVQTAPKRGADICHLKVTNSLLTFATGGATCLGRNGLPEVTRSQST